MNHSRSRQRHGVTTVECAIVLSTLLVLILGALEVSVLTIRHVALAEAARRGTRAAIVRGGVSIVEQLGPDDISCQANAENSIAVACAKMLPTMSPDDVRIEVNWPNDTNQLEDPVEVELSYSHRFIVPLLNSDSPLQLRASSCMYITR